MADTLKLCKNSNCRIRLNCRRYIKRLHMAGKGKDLNHTTDIQLTDTKIKRCSLYIKL